MAGEVKVARTYDSSRRRAQAEATRRQILDASRRLFLERGYGRTTIDTIAREARVAPETVYAAFKSKRAILRRLLDIAAVGDMVAQPLRERPWLRDLRAVPDRHARVRMLATEATSVLERSTDLLMVLRDAASTDPRLAAEWEDANRLMRIDHAVFVRALAGDTGFRDGVTEESAADIVWTIAGPEVYQRLVRWRGWSPADYEHWAADTLDHALFG